MDPLSRGSYHEVFNSSSLKMFSCIYDSIDYYASKSSYDSVLKEFGGILPENIKYHRLFVSNIKGPLGGFLHQFIANVVVVFMVLFSKKNSVVFVNNNPLWCLKTLNRILKYRKLTDVILMFHGELEVPRRGIRRNRFTMSALKFISSKTFNPADNLYFCVLGESIIRNLHLVVHENVKKKFISFEHTFIRNRFYRFKKTDNKVRIGFSCTVHESHGLNDIIKLSDILMNQNNIEFYAIGRLLCDPGILESHSIKYISGYGSSLIPTEIMDEYIQQMDLMVYCYPKDDYKLTASGAIFNSINHGKTVYAINNDYFDYIFERANIGRLFPSIEALADGIRDYINSPDDRPISKVEVFTPEFESMVLKKKLKELELL